MRTGFLVLAITAISAAAGTSAAPISPNSPVLPHPFLLPAEGWWEREHREERARQAYLKLSPNEIHRYNRLQHELNRLVRDRHELDERIRRIEDEQHDILGMR